MPRNASGTYTLPAGNPVVTGTTISSTVHNNTLTDIGNEITDSLSRSGEGAMLAALELVDGVIATPGLSWDTEPTSGFYRNAAGDFRFAIGGADVLRIDGTLGVIVTDFTVGDLTATDLTVTDDLTVQSQLLLADGTVGAPALSFTSNPDTGLYLSGSIMDFASDGVACVRFTFGGGNVRIISPDTVGDCYLAFYESDISTRKGYIGYGSATQDDLYIQQDEAESIFLRIGSNTILEVGTTILTYLSDGPTDELGFRDIVRSAGSNGETLTAVMRGTCRVYTATGCTVPNSVFSGGDAVSLYNSSASAITITQGSGVTMRLAGTTTTGSRTLAARGFATLWFNSASEVLVMGTGVS